MRINFRKSLARVLKHEGGWAKHPRDPGGATMKGVTKRVYEAFLGHSVSDGELRNIPDKNVASIYRQRYWNVVAGDNLPTGVDFCTFDAAVNSGPRRAAKWLQRAMPLLAVDGRVGPQTVYRAGQVDTVQTVNRMCDDRMAFLRRLSHWGTFGRGWTRRVKDVRAQSLEDIRRNPARDNTTTGVGTGAGGGVVYETGDVLLGLFVLFVTFVVVMYWHRDWVKTKIRHIRDRIVLGRAGVEKLIEDGRQRVLTEG